MKTNKLFHMILLVLCAVLVGGVLSTAYAKTVTIAITAQVASVDDSSNILNGEVQVGQIITGHYVYESTTADTNALPQVGDYWHTVSPYGIVLNMGQRVFKTDPDNVSFLMEMVNDYYAMDNYLLRSYKNLSIPILPNGGIVDHIAWQLDDYTATALADSTLPDVAPVLTAWQSISGLTIQGCVPDFTGMCGFDNLFFIRAQVTDATLVTEGVTVSVDMKPDTLNRNSNGKYVTAYMELRGEYARKDIAFDSIRLSAINGEKLAVPLYASGYAAFGVYDTDTIHDLMVRFDLPTLVHLLPTGNVQLTVSGQFADGTPFEGNDIIRVISR
jgi:hypothetical protein